MVIGVSLYWKKLITSENFSIFLNIHIFFWLTYLGLNSNSNYLSPKSTTKYLMSWSFSFLKANSAHEKRKRKTKATLT